jgi:hypothetical protein
MAYPCRKNLRARFYPDSFPSDVRYYQFVIDDYETDKGHTVLLENTPADVDANKTILVELEDISEDVLTGISRSVEGVPASFMRHKEGVWRVQAVVAFPEGIESKGYGYARNYKAKNAVIESTEKTAWKGDIETKFDYHRYYSTRYLEFFIVTPRDPGKEPGLKAEMDIHSENVAKIGCGVFAAKLETMGDGTEWMKVIMGGGWVGEPDTGYLHLPDVDLKLLANDE